MRTAPLKRLLYKELRESWLILLVLFVLPVVAVSMDQHRRSAFTDGFVMVTWLLMPALVLAWALSKSDVRIGGGRAFSGGLPVRPMVEWLTSTLLPILAMVPIGLWLAEWQSIASPNSALGDSPLETGLGYMAMFAAALVVARLTSIWVGLAAALAVIGLAPSMPSETETNWYLGVMIAAVGLSLIQVIARKKTVKARGVWSVVWLLALIGAPVVQTWLDTRPYPSGSSISIPNKIITINNAVTIEFHAISGQQKQQTITASTGGPPGFSEGKRVVTRSRIVPITIWAATAFGDTLYLVPPGRGLGRKARLVAWDFDTDTMRDVCTIPTRAYRFGNSDTDASVSPDGSQMLIKLPSLLGDYENYTQDLWLVDLRTGEKHLCVSSIEFYITSVGWSARDAILTYSYGYISVDRTTGKTTTHALPKMEALK